LARRQPVAAAEVEQLQKAIQADGKDFELAVDWLYYAEKVCSRARFG
jgi:Zn-dependent oligopeptidase